MRISERKSVAYRFSVRRAGKEIGRAYLYLIHNDLHKRPYALLEDLEVLRKFRKDGIGKELIASVFALARSKRCYKIIGTSRNTKARAYVHDWYQRLGFKAYGTEFRMNL